MNNYTPRAQQVLSLAGQAADKLQHSYVGTEHILLGLLDLRQGATATLESLGIDTQDLRNRFVAAMEGGGWPQKPVPDPAATKVALAPMTGSIRSSRCPPERAEPAIEAKRPSSEVRYYVAIDLGTQWSCVLVRREVTGEHVGQKKGPSVYTETVVKEDNTDIPAEVRDCAFLVNVFGRQSTNLKLKDGQSYGAWSISAAEAARIVTLIKLLPEFKTFNQLSAYSV